MNNRTVYAIIVAFILFGVSMGLRLGGQEGPQIILFFLTFLILGIVAVGIKIGLLLSFVLSFGFQLITNVIISPEIFGAFSNPNIGAAILLMTLLNSVILGALGAAGGFIGKIIFKKKDANKPTQISS